MKKKSLKRGLLTSALSIFMMLGIMVGTSFAWFNVTIENQGARIQAGNLAVEFLAADNVNFTGADDLSESSDPVFEFPATAQPGDNITRYLKVTNKGSILLDYEVLFRVVNDTGLGEAIDVEVDKLTPDEPSETYTGVSINNQILEHSGSGMDEDSSETYEITLTFNPTAGMDFQGKSYSLDLLMVAWQFAYQDSKPVYVSTLTELENAATSVKKGQTVVLLESINSTTTDISFSKLINLDLKGHTLTLKSLTVASEDNGFMRFENGELNAETYTINTPNAELTHALDFTVNASVSVVITASSNSYVLLGILNTVDLSVLGNTSFKPQATSELVITGTITKSLNANLSPVSGAMITVPVQEVALINRVPGVLIGQSMVKSGESIQDAIDTANTGDTIIVGPGLFLEEIMFSERTNLTLEGQVNGSTIIGPVREYANGNNGITIDRSQNITVRYVTIDGYANPEIGEVPTFRDGVHYLVDAENHDNTFEYMTIKNIDRRGISVFPMTTTNTTIRGNTVDNVTGALNGTFNGAIGINFQGTGLVEDNEVKNIHTGIVHNSDLPDGVIEIRNNNIHSFKATTIINIGISVWPRKSETMIIEDNIIHSTVSRQVGMYINSISSTSRIKGNTLTLTAEYVIGLDLLNNKDGGYQVIENSISVGAHSTAIVLSSLGTAILPMQIEQNLIVNTSPEAIFNFYEFYEFFDTNISSREVGILISGSLDTKRIKDTLSPTYANITNNSIEDFLEGVVIFENDLGNAAFSGNVFESVGDETLTVKSIQSWSEDANISWYGDGSATTYIVSTASELAGLAKLVNEGTTFLDKTIELGNNINLLNIDWTPIGFDWVTSNQASTDKPFRGVFDGKDFTIFNLQVSEAGNNYVGLFGAVNGTIKNLIVNNALITGQDYVGTVVGNINGSIENIQIKNANTTGNHFVGGIAGLIQGYGSSTSQFITMKNVSIEDSVITGLYNTAINDDGDKVGGIVGYMRYARIQGATVDSVTVTGYRDVGGVVGAGATDSKYEIKDVSITDSIVQATLQGQAGHATPYVGAIIGRPDGSGNNVLYLSDFTVTNTTVTSYNQDFAGNPYSSKFTNIVNGTLPE